jgi:hypothetical protein
MRKYELSADTKTFKVDGHGKLGGGGAVAGLCF